MHSCCVFYLHWNCLSASPNPGEPCLPISTACKHRGIHHWCSEVQSERHGCRHRQGPGRSTSCFMIYDHQKHTHYQKVIWNVQESWNKIKLFFSLNRESSWRNSGVQSIKSYLMMARRWGELCTAGVFITFHLRFVTQSLNNNNNNNTVFFSF